MDKELLYRFFDGSASPEETEQIRQWLDESPAHQKEFLKQRRVFDAMILLPGVEDETVPIPEDETVADPPVYIGRKRLLFTIVRYAAVVVLTVGITLSLFRYFSPADTPVMLTASVPAGQRAQIMLPDSSTVWLNSGSTLVYPSAFKDGRRDVKLEGEGYFTVTKNAHKPFTVNTPNGYVTVLGTVFNVKSYRDESRFEASLVSGKVKAKGSSGREVVLQPHQKMVWEDGRVQVLSTNDDDYLWKKGILTFNDQSLETVMNDLSRAFNRKIIIKGNDIRHEMLTGKFRISDGLDYALQILRDMYGFRYSTNPDTGVTEVYK